MYTALMYMAIMYTAFVFITIMYTAVAYMAVVHTAIAFTAVLVIVLIWYRNVLVVCPDLLIANSKYASQSRESRKGCPYHHSFMIRVSSLFLKESSDGAILTPTGRRFHF